MFSYENSSRVFRTGESCILKTFLLFQLYLSAYCKFSTELQIYEFEVSGSSCNSTEYLKATEMHMKQKISISLKAENSNRI